jgi:hypothetical protein
MSHVEVTATGHFPPPVFVAALTDFGPGRSKIWGNSSEGHLAVHDRGDTWADVTEGTDVGGIWQRYRYDWSTPDVVRLDVTDSNAFGPGSFWEYRLTPVGAAGDQTEIHLTINRNPTTTKGKLFDPMLKLIGRVYFGRDLRRTIRLIEQSTQGNEPSGDAGQSSATP